MPRAIGSALFQIKNVHAFPHRNAYFDEKTSYTNSWEWGGLLTCQPVTKIARLRNICWCRGISYLTWIDSIPLKSTVDSSKKIWWQKFVSRFSRQTWEFVWLCCYNVLFLLSYLLNVLSHWKPWNFHCWNFKYSKEAADETFQRKFN